MAAAVPAEEAWKIVEILILRHQLRRAVRLRVHRLLGDAGRRQGA